MPNYFVLENQLAELKSGEDVAIIFNEGNFLQDNQNRQTFKKTLQIIEKSDLVTKLEIYIGASK